MTKYKKPTYIIIQEAMAERIRFLEDDCIKGPIRISRN